VGDGAVDGQLAVLSGEGFLDADAGVVPQLDVAVAEVVNAGDGREVEGPADDVLAGQALQGALVVERAVVVGDALALENQVLGNVEVGAGGQGLQVQGGAVEDDGAGLDGVAAGDGAAEGLVGLDGDPALLDQGLGGVGVVGSQDQVAGADLGEVGD